jgi:hypothetical protein
LASDRLRQVFSPRDDKLFPLTIGELRVRQGDHVEAGALLMTLRTATGKTLAMRSPLAGSISMIAAGAGDSLASPRVLVTIAETGEDIVDGEWEDAPERPPEVSDPAPQKDQPPGADRASEETVRSRDGETSRDRRGRGRRIAAAIAVLAVLIGGYAIYAQDSGSRTPARTAPPGKAAGTVNGSASQPPRTQKRAPYDGPLSRSAMLKRDIGATPLGWHDDGRFIGHGQLTISFPDDRNAACEAVLVARRYVAFSRLCYDPGATRNMTREGMRVTFQAFRAAAQSDGRGGHQDIRGFWRVWKIDAAAIHLWPRPVDGSSTSIALAELVNPAPGAIGTSGHWRFTESSAPPVLHLRNLSFLQPEKLYRQGVSCRYWLADGARRPTGEDPMPLLVDPDCSGSEEMTSGVVRVPYSNGKSYFAGFFQARARTGDTPFIFAAGFSKADDRIIRGAREGTLPPGAVTLTPTGRSERSRLAQILVANPCKSEKRFHVIGVDKSSGNKRRIEYAIPAGKATWIKNTLGTRYDYFGLNQAGGKRGPGTRKFRFRSRTYHLVPFNNDSSVGAMATASCN